MHGEIEKCQDLQQSGIQPFAYNYKKTHSIQAICEQYAALEIGEHATETVSIAGRLIALVVFDSKVN